MDEYKITYRSYEEEELPEKYRRLVEAARKASERSYAPYSRFRVGAACLLRNGGIVQGCNQESPVFPAGICAERNALFTACSGYVGQVILAVAVWAAEGDTPAANASPCGICRQTFLDTEERQQAPIEVIFRWNGKYMVFASAKELLPFSFRFNFPK